MANQDDQELISRAQHSDKEAVATLYEMYRQQIFRYLYYQVGEQHTA